MSQQIPTTPVEGMTPLQATQTDFNGMRITPGGVKYPHAVMWRGDHRRSGCNHAGGTCGALTGWILNAEGRAVPAKTNVPTSPQARGLVTVFIPSVDPLTGLPAMQGRTEESWRHKGNVSLTEAEGVRPSPPVLARLIMRGQRELERQIEREPFETRKRLIAEFQAKTREVNAPPPKMQKPERSKA